MCGKADNKDPKHSNNQVVISGLAYIDAVANNNTAGRDVALPHVFPRSLLNLIQTNTPILKDGQSADEAVWGWPYMVNPQLPGYDGTGFGYYGRFREIDVDMVIGSDGKLTKKDVATHLSIDDQEAPVVSQFIRDVLHGWYDTTNHICT